MTYLIKLKESLVLTLAIYSINFLLSSTTWALDPLAESEFIDNVIKSNYSKVKKILLSGGTNIMSDKKGYPATIISVKNNNKKMLDLLLSHGVEVDLVDRNKNTALSWALELQNTELAIYLITKNANINLVNNIGQTPLLIAARQGLSQVIEIMLVTGKADLQQRDYVGKSAVDYAKDGQHFKLAELLQVFVNQ